MNKKKILIITPRYPYPTIGGDRLRIFEVCKELSKYYSLTLISLCDSKSELLSPLPDDKIFEIIHRIYLPKWKSFFSTALNIFGKKPLQVSYYKSNKLRRKIHSIIEEYDLVIPHLIRMADYVKSYDIPKILEMTDAISMNYTRICEVKNNAGIKGIIYKLEKSKLLKYEKQIPYYFNYNVLVSNYDKEFLFKNNDDLYSRSIVCSNGVDLSKLPYKFTPSTYKLIFIGNMYSAQNFDAAYWFAKNIIPSLQQYGPYEFHIIGRISIDKAKKLKKISGVSVIGSVDKVSEYAHGALAGICSVRLAAGVQNKILEYMALGIPTVTSSIGLEGLAAKKNKDLLVADTIEEYISAITTLNTNSNFAENIAKNALSYVKQYHSWPSKLAPLIHSINSILR